MTDERTNNSLVIGVKRIAVGTVAEPGEPASGSIHILWAELAGVMLPRVWQNALLSVDYHADGKGFHTATVTFAVADFKSVDWREVALLDEEPAE